ncbi:MAG: ATP-binding cassette domain-containing protein [Peptococcaceae bacterium]|jgi:urea transport system ATP-binding protein|nr:ATP-binding cassette domain-containing protein [Peptococcaceae bacterium]
MAAKRNVSDKAFRRLLEIEDLHVNYGKSRVIHGISLEVSQGEKLVIMGRNGMGKTTLVKSIVGVLPVVGGEIFFGNETIAKRSSSWRSKKGIAYVPQGREIIPDFTVKENLELGAIAHISESGQGKYTMEQRMETVFTYFPAIKEHLHRKGGVLSGGQQQQLAIGRALMSRPVMILLDEPTDGIQPNVVADLADTLNQIRKDLHVTIIIVEQNLKFAFKIAERYIIIQKGMIVSRGQVSELTDSLISKYLSV